MSFIEKLFGNFSDKELKRIRPLAKKVEDLEPQMQKLSDEELRGKTSAIIKNSQYSFIFKLSAPDMKDVLDIYKAGDSFNDEEQRMIISAVTGQTFFVGSTELRNCILVKAGDYTQSLFEERKEEETD